ncbi:MAG TPA: tyrosine-protein phosphatase [Bryobacteraceae bacterium]|jgi:protein tyrosine/serine phosphatase|nr:tyrosine-protein phosphatase [Bryobacteraceae bacterium]
MKAFGLPVLAILGGIVLTGSSSAAVTPQSLTNFQAVEESLYRGAQPGDKGFRELAKMGIHTVVDLRGGGSRATKEGELVTSLGMHYVNIPLSGYSAPTQEQVSKLFAILENQKDGPVFVHCRRGADRTGTILALYRIQYDHWQNQKALDEAKTMKMASSERLMRNLILSYRPVDAAVR